MTYDGEDRLKTLSRAGSLRQSNDYDGNGNLIGQTDANEVRTSYSYDAANQRIGSVRADHTQAWTYSATHQIKTHTDADGDLSSFDYDLRDRLTHERNGEGEERV